jgi:hypothetical protein
MLVAKDCVKTWVKDSASSKNPTSGFLEEPQNTQEDFSPERKLRSELEQKCQKIGETQIGSSQLAFQAERYLARESRKKIIPDQFRTEQDEIEDIFKALANKWRSETRGTASINEISMHPAYQQIIGMGEVVVPLLLRELERKSGFWFWALKAITRADPVPLEDKGKVPRMIQAWLDWGKREGYNW